MTKISPIVCVFFFSALALFVVSYFRSVLGPETPRPASKRDPSLPPGRSLSSFRTFVLTLLGVLENARPVKKTARSAVAPIIPVSRASSVHARTGPSAQVPEGGGRSKGSLRAQKAV